MSVFNISQLRRHHKTIASSLIAWVLFAIATPPALGHGALHDRIDALEDAIADDPQNVKLHFELADVLSQHDEWEQALSAVERVEALAPGRFPTDLVRGRALLTGQNYTAALDSLNRFIDNHKSNAAAYTVRARTHAALGNKNLCLDDYRTAVKLSPKDHELIQEAAAAFAANDRADEAITLIEDAIRALGPEPVLLIQAMELEIAIGRYDSALSRMDALQKTAPRPELWMARRARTLAKAGRTSDATAAWKTLSNHIASLPPLQRGAPDLHKLAEEANQSLTLSK